MKTKIENLVDLVASQGGSEVVVNTTVGATIGVALGKIIIGTPQPIEGTAVNTVNEVTNVQQRYFIRVPKFLDKKIRRIPEPMLKAIHKDIDVAVQRVLYFISTLFNKSDNMGEFKTLNAQIMKRNCSDYSKIIQALRCGLSFGGDSILKCNGKYGDYTSDGSSLKYCIRGQYLGFGMINYELTDATCINRLVKRRQMFLMVESVFLQGKARRLKLKSVENIDSKPDELIW